MTNRHFSRGRSDTQTRNISAVRSRTLLGYSFRIAFDVVLTTYYFLLTRIISVSKGDSRFVIELRERFCGCSRRSNEYMYEFVPPAVEEQLFGTVPGTRTV